MQLSLEKIYITYLFAIICVIVLIAKVQISYAAVSFDPLPDLKSYNDFVVGPGKIEVEMSPGESRTFEITAANRLGSDRTFSVSEEDFTGSKDLKQTILLLGDDHGPYSLRDYIHLGTTTIDIPHGSRARIPVTISIPDNSQPGGLYGSVIVGTLSRPAPTVTSEGGATASSPVITRIGTLFFVRIKGAVNEDGKLTQFMLPGNRHFLFDSNSVIFDLLYQNNGNVHLDPHGSIAITNMLGSVVGTINVEPWFAMPQSLRFREVHWNPPFLFGRYVAHASIQRGYGTVSDEVELVFWVIPWKIILSVLVGLIIVIAGIRWIFSRFKISKR